MNPIGLRKPTYSAVLFLVTTACLVGSAGADAQKVQTWLTTPDRTNLVARQKPVRFHRKDAASPVIRVNDAKTYQVIDGFGHAVTGGTATDDEDVAGGAAYAA
jgi:glucosylceramidase